LASSCCVVNIERGVKRAQEEDAKMVKVQ